jgi:hypothetical protein
MWTAMHVSWVEVVLPIVAMPKMAQMSTVPAVPAVCGVGICNVGGIPGRTSGHGHKCGRCRYVPDLPRSSSCAHGVICLLSIAMNCRRDEVYQSVSQRGRNASVHAG